MNEHDKILILHRPQLLGRNSFHHHLPPKTAPAGLCDGRQDEHVVTSEKSAKADDKRAAAQCPEGC